MATLTLHFKLAPASLSSLGSTPRPGPRGQHFMPRSSNLRRPDSGQLGRLLAVAFVLAVAGTAGRLHAQARPATSTKPAPPPSYVSRTMVPSQVGEYLLALGDRIQKPGKERSTLAGTSTDQ